MDDGRWLEDGRLDARWMEGRWMDNGWRIGGWRVDGWMLDGWMINGWIHGRMDAGCTDDRQLTIGLTVDGWMDG